MLPFILLLYLVILISFLHYHPNCAQDIEQFVPVIGKTFCKYLAHRQILPRKYIRDCAEPTCTWDDWQSALSGINNSFSLKNAANYTRIVLSYGHNGFGNQLWQHSVAFMIAEAMKSRLLIGMIPDTLSPGMNPLPFSVFQFFSALSRFFLFFSLLISSCFDQVVIFLLIR
jgi:hypothetical protein